MSIRSAADAAIAAENAQLKAEGDRNWANHAREAEQIVMSLTGLKGKTVRARRTAPADISPWGDDAVVEIPDDDQSIYVKVDFPINYRRDGWNQVSSRVGSPCLLLASADNQYYTWFNAPTGSKTWSASDHKIRSLADLGKALKSLDAFMNKHKAAET